MSKKNGIEWVVSVVLEDGTRIRGVKTAWYGSPAIDFFLKDNGIKRIKVATAEKMYHFERFLADGFRIPLTEEELAR